MPPTNVRGRGRSACAGTLDELHPDVAVLRDRRLPGSSATVDHLVVAANGVWLVDERHYTGQVTIVDRGDWSGPDMRLLVGGRDRTGLVGASTQKVSAVGRVLARLADPPTVHGALCFLDDEWHWAFRPLVLGGVLLAWGAAIVERLREPGRLGPDERTAVCEVLDAACPPASRPSPPPGEGPAPQTD